MRALPPLLGNNLSVRYSLKFKEKVQLVNLFTKLFSKKEKAIVKKGAKPDRKSTAPAGRKLAAEKEETPQDAFFESASSIVFVTCIFILKPESEFSFEYEFDPLLTSSKRDEARHANNSHAKVSEDENAEDIKKMKKERKAEGKAVANETTLTEEDRRCERY